MRTLLESSTTTVTVLFFSPFILLTNHSISFYHILSYDSFSLVDFFLTPLHLFKLRLNPFIYTFTYTLVLFNLTYADQGLQSTSFLARLVPRGTLRLLCLLFSRHL